MEHAIYYAILALISVVAFFAGRFQTETLKTALPAAVTVLNSYPILKEWAIAACKYMKQYFEKSDGAAKNEMAAQMIVGIAEASGLTISLEQAKVLAQAAYDEWMNGMASKTEK